MDMTNKELELFKKLTLIILEKFETEKDEQEKEKLLAELKDALRD